MTLLSSRPLILALLSCFILASCGGEKDKTETPIQPDELSPAETQGLSLKEQEELKIDEDNVMNPFPG